MKYGQTVIVNRSDHPLCSRRGIVYRILGNKVTVLFDREILYDFTTDELVTSEQGQDLTAHSIISSLG